MSFFEELKRRNVFRVGIAYAVVGWLLMQVTDTFSPALRLPEWFPSAVAFLLLIGFPVALFFAWAFELTPGGIKRESEVDPAQSVTPQTARKLDRMIIVALVAVVGVLLADRFMGEKGQETVSETGVAAQSSTNASKAAEMPASTSNEKSIAVLPFVNMSSDAEQEYFSDGITEEILNALARVSQLKVAGRTSSFAFKGTNQDLRVIGQALGVEHILEGSVRKSGDRIRITAQLIKVDDGFHIWSETFDREMTDIFTIQDEISAAILEQMKAHLIGDETVAVTKVDLKVYEIYLLARQKVYIRDPQTIGEARALLDQVITADPDFAPAYAQQALCIMLSADHPEMYGQIPVPEARAAAKPLLDRALELDPMLAEGHAALAMYYYLANDYVNARKLLTTALSINPIMTDANNWLNVVHSHLGNLRESWKLLEQLHARDPLYRPGIINLSVAYSAQERLADIGRMIDRLTPVWTGGALLRSMQARLDGDLGHQAQAIIEFRALLVEYPGLAPARFLQQFQLFDLMEYQSVLDQDIDRPIEGLALSRLGRYEEARIYLNQLAAKGQGVDELIRTLEENGRYEEIINLIESRWPDLDAFETDFPQRQGFGSDSLGSIAYAYLQAGQPDKFDMVMTRFRAALDHQVEQGADNRFLSFSRAFYSILNNQEDQALAHYARALEQGLLVHPRFYDLTKAFKPLQANPGFESIHSPMVEHINSERAKLGLAPYQDGPTT